MNRTDVMEHVRIALSAVLKRDLVDLTEETRLFEDLALDSTSVIELLMGLEDVLGVEVDPDDLAPEVFATAGSLADYVQARVGAAVAP
ncbi:MULTISPECIES: acyl carrier protein [unclassified Saccharothrix]|uniref:acyl carrier protein n=1 Tax=unclassified Saccharothrix TaxID=2593673 RepID=UPI00307D2F46